MQHGLQTKLQQSDGYKEQTGLCETLLEKEEDMIVN